MSDICQRSLAAQVDITTLDKEYLVTTVNEFVFMINSAHPRRDAVEQGGAIKVMTKILEDDEYRLEYYRSRHYV